MNVLWSDCKKEKKKYIDILSKILNDLKNKKKKKALHNFFKKEFKENNLQSILIINKYYFKRIALDIFTKIVNI